MIYFNRIALAVFTMVLASSGLHSIQMGVYSFGVFCLTWSLIFAVQGLEPINHAE